ncbi:transcriptional repressor [Campylobacter sp. FMV-PI01]|uniref:Transcriptional repressor n=1 Tax=Campylobacter portucalensis TaxID=2608384 RepID=A0A6L5WI32_9BACT|nr:Fur family transcriptional regulator [Campylobacter portucalensis]MSN95665.1 transcriptional repressor [Campylobacter portucalensis]
MMFLEMLKNRGLKATPQRISVLRILGKHTHPTIDELYDEIKKEHPSISLATIYKNLSTLIENGLAVEILMPNQKSKFDIYERPHIHVVCEKCGEIYDFYDEVCEICSYQQNLEKKISSEITKFNITATICDCKNCQST